MRVFLYEWVTGGGLADHHGPLPRGLEPQGRAMAQALAADLVAAGARVTLLRDYRAGSLVARRATFYEVASREDHDEAFSAAAAEADLAIALAPETDGVLAGVVRRLMNLGVSLASPGVQFVAIAGHKERAAEALDAAGVPTPRATRVEPEQDLPKNFAYPAVLKPLDGAGAEDTYVVVDADDTPPPYAWPRRLEEFIPGLAASVAAIGVAGGEVLLSPPCRQLVTTDGPVRYLGGATPLAPGLAERATALAKQALGALPPLVGYAGVDLVLGQDPDGSGDVVIEVNPRLTTSYVGLRAACRDNLAAAMLAAAAGEPSALRFDPRPLAWDAQGTVSYT